MGEVEASGGCDTGSGGCFKARFNCCPPARPLRRPARRARRVRGRPAANTIRRRRPPRPPVPIRPPLPSRLSDHATTAPSRPPDARRNGRRARRIASLWAERDTPGRRAACLRDPFPGSSRPSPPSAPPVASSVPVASNARGRRLVGISGHHGVLPRRSDARSAPSCPGCRRPRYPRPDSVPSTPGIPATPASVLRLAGVRVEERDATVTGRRQFLRARPGDGADGAGMIFGPPDLRAVHVIYANLPGGRWPPAIGRPATTPRFPPSRFRRRSSRLPGASGGAPDQDPAVLPGRGERGSRPACIATAEQAALMDLATVPRRARRICRRTRRHRPRNHRPSGPRRAGSNPPRWRSRRPTRTNPRRSAPLELPGVQTRHASNPFRMLCSSRLRPMKTS